MNNRIQSVFAKLQADGDTALIPYIMAGDPSLEDTEALVLRLERAGADLIELGVPFSDPIADGPVIQHAADRALRSGTSLSLILQTVKALRTRTQIPLILMTYYNTILAMGEDHFCRKAVDAGVDGLIVPDMPPEEADRLAHASQKAGGPLIVFLLAPTSTKDRQMQVMKRSNGFIYYVSLTGITGATLHDTADVERNVRNIRRSARVPIAVGFGISTPEQAGRVGKFADGIIIGSAIVQMVSRLPDSPKMIEKIEEFVRACKHQLRAS